jgi:transposase
VRQMMPPLNRTVVELAEETGITGQTLHAWRRKARAMGVAVPGNGKTADNWSSEEKFRVVLECATLSEAELGEYCRRKGLYPEQIRQWREVCEQANARQAVHEAAGRETSKQSRKRIRQLERELRRKEAALAEAAALLVLRKKVAAIWGEGEDD